jgi:hypothetical protein
MVDFRSSMASPLKPTKAIAAITSSRTAATMKQPRRFARSVGEFGVLRRSMACLEKKRAYGRLEPRRSHGSSLSLTVRVRAGYSYRSRRIHHD